MTGTDTPLHENLSFLQRKYHPRRRIARGLLGAAPLVDVALLVFLFFLVNSSFVLQPGVLVHLPESPFMAGAPYGSMVVTISQEGMIFFNDERTPLEGLNFAFSQAIHESPDATLIIEADHGVPHGTVVGIYNMAIAADIREVALGTGLLPAGETEP